MNAEDHFKLVVALRKELLQTRQDAARDIKGLYNVASLAWLLVLLGLIISIGFMTYAYTELYPK